MSFKSPQKGNQKKYKTPKAQKTAAAFLEGGGSGSDGEDVRALPCTWKLNEDALHSCLGAAGWVLA